MKNLLLFQTSKIITIIITSYERFFGEMYICDALHDLEPFTQF